MSRSAYSKRTCDICEPLQDISSAGAAWVAHGRAHVRAGEAIERRDWINRAEFLSITTANRRVKQIKEQLTTDDPPWNFMEAKLHRELAELERKLGA